MNKKGSYSTKVKQTKGKVSLTLQFSYRDKERLKTYLDKYKLSLSLDIPFHAGFLVLKSAPNLEFEDPSIFIEKRPNTISLTGTIGQQPFLYDAEARHDSNWTSRFTYNVLESKEKQTPLPVQIIPTLVQEGAQRSIDLVIQISPDVTNSKELGTVCIEEFILYAPQRLSKIVRVEPSAFIGVEVGHDDDEHLKKITWKGVSINSGFRHERRQIFYVQFENKIEPNTIFHGKLKAILSETHTEFEDSKFFYPWGQELSDVNPLKKQTYIDVDFELNLGGLRFQEIVQKSGHLLREGVLPNHTIVTNLTDELNDADFYVKRVIENPARTSKEGAHKTNRYWDMAGRYYEGVYPIDFHLVLTGEEAYSRASESWIQVDITVQGFVANDDMRNKVTHLLEQLSAITENTLDNLPQVPKDQSVTDIYSNLDLESEIELKSSHSSQPDDIPTSNQIAQLLKMLTKLDEALLEGRITKNRYDEIQKRYNNQLIELGYTI